MQADIPWVMWVGWRRARSVPDHCSIDPALLPPDPTTVISLLRHHFYTLIFLLPPFLSV